MKTCDAAKSSNATNEIDVRRYEIEVKIKKWHDINNYQAMLILLFQERKNLNKHEKFG